MNIDDVRVISMNCCVSIKWLNMDVKCVKQDGNGVRFRFIYEGSICNQNVAFGEML